MACTWKRTVSRAMFALVAAVAVVNTGCIAAAVTAAAAGGAAVGYAYYTAPLIQDYPASYGDSLAAVKAALTDLQFPIVKEQPVDAGAVIETRTGDGVKVRVSLDLVTSAVPADGSLTRVSVRVGHFGDETISTRIQDQIAKHLPAVAAPPSPTLQAPRPPETAPPPLAPHK
jgi:Protein of unknown function (DUF3568)